MAVLFVHLICGIISLGISMGSYSPVTAYLYSAMLAIGKEQP